jgi:glycerate 2-kinase
MMNRTNAGQAADRVVLGQLHDSFQAALRAADPRSTLASFLPEAPAGRVLVVGAGKAAASMACAVEQHWRGKVALEGLVITRYAHGLSTDFIRVIEAGHPVPDEAGEAAAREILERAATLAPQDLLLVLLSGGGSSLMSLPAPGLSMPELKALNQVLLASGAPITDMNVVRKHVSAIAGGRLAAATPARVLALIVSDVSGDDLSAVASGPCIGDASTYADALAIIARHAMAVPPAILKHLQRGARGELAETPKPGHALFERVDNRLIGDAHGALEAGVACLRDHGYAVANLGDTVSGEAREVAQVYAALVREIRGFGQPWKAPVALVSGGECTVTLRDSGAGGARGGRCTEFLLALALALRSMAGVYALACDTDGIDGSENNAGAVLTPESLRRAAERGVDAQACLDRHDAWGFFEASEGLVVTGPTRTNVNDYRVILIT